MWSFDEKTTTPIKKEACILKLLRLLLREYGRFHHFKSNNKYVEDEISRKFRNILRIFLGPNIIEYNMLVNFVETGHWVHDIEIPL